MVGHFLEVFWCKPFMLHGENCKAVDSPVILHHIPQTDSGCMAHLLSLCGSPKQQLNTCPGQCFCDTHNSRSIPRQCYKWADQSKRAA